jgi:FKBP-type peptidyl-prolyl cis-trans isomerase (trigger factor)
MRKAAEQAFEALELPFMLTPEVFALKDMQEGQPLEFRAKAHGVPDMKIDLETPAKQEGFPAPANPDEPTAYERKRARRVLKARLNGTVPEPLAKAAMKLRQEEFHRELRQQGMTYREWRIQNNMKPADVDAMIYEETVSKLFEDIALDLAFFRNGLGISPEHEAAVLAEIAPGRESALFEDLADAGRLCLLKQKARRSVAEQWAVKSLL